jgi:hypothetical protein
MFAKVLDLGAEYVEEADKDWKLIRKIHKATPKTTAGKKIAIVTGITRADAAALFVEELKINELYEKKGISNVLSDDSGKTEKERKPSVSAADIAGSPFENDIEIVLNTGINGLGLYPDNTFRPDELVTRASCAVMIDDVLKKIAENGETHVNSITNRSSFTDMKNDLPYFDAVMAVTGRGLMHAENFTTGEFSPSSPISGVDALLIIKNLKEELRYF